MQLHRNSTPPVTGSSKQGQEEYPTVTTHMHIPPHRPSHPPCECSQIALTRRIPFPKTLCASDTRSQLRAAAVAATTHIPQAAPTAPGRHQNIMLPHARPGATAMHQPNAKACRTVLRSTANAQLQINTTQPEVTHTSDSFSSP